MTSTLKVHVGIDSDELREWADWHTDAGHHGVAHILYQAANEAESLTEQALREARAAALREAADELDLPGSDATGYYSGGYVDGYHEAERHAEQRLRARADRIERGEP